MDIVGVWDVRMPLFWNTVSFLKRVKIDNTKKNKKNGEVHVDDETKWTTTYSIPKVKINA